MSANHAGTCAWDAAWALRQSCKGGMTAKAIKKRPPSEAFGYWQQHNISLKTTSSYQSHNMSSKPEPGSENPPKQPDSENPPETGPPKPGPGRCLDCIDPPCNAYVGALQQNAECQRTTCRPHQYQRHAICTSIFLLRGEFRFCF